MVSDQAQKRTTVKAKIAMVGGAFVVAFLMAAVIAGFLKPVENNFTVVEDEPETSGWVTKINLQPVVDSWVNSVSGEKGVEIYDLSTNETVGEYNANERMRIESIYKLFVVYEGYLRVQRGEWDRNAACGGTGWTILECLDKAVRESNSAAADTLWGMIGRDELDAIVQNEWGLPEVVVGSISATPMEIMKIMRKFYYHEEITDAELVSVMMDSFLNQPPTTYDWRRGLPSGFSENVKVYNKVGWLHTGARWLYYDDAAIVEFPSRKLIIVVLTKYVDNKDIARFAREIEASMY